MFIKNLDPKVKERHLEDAFGPFGEIERAIVIRERFTNESRGYGFVTYAKKESTSEAISKLNQTELKGKQISVELSHRSKARTTSCRSGSRR